MGGRCNEVVFGIPQCGTDSIHGIRDILWCVASHVLLDRVAEQLAPRFLGSLREPLRSFKNVVGNGNRSLHTISITAAVWRSPKGGAAFFMLCAASPASWRTRLHPPRTPCSPPGRIPTPSGESAPWSDRRPPPTLASATAPIPACPCASCPPTRAVRGQAPRNCERISEEHTSEL